MSPYRTADPPEPQPTSLLDLVLSIGPYLLARWWGRLLVLVTAPAWALTGIALVITAAFVMVVLAWTWCPAVRVVSWVAYGDQYALGNLWWTLEDHMSWQHRQRTKEARQKAGLPTPIERRAS